MTIFCYGTITNYGTISMTARGANAVGQNIYLYKDELVPAIGASGHPSVLLNAYSTNALSGNNGVNRQTGAGGRGRTKTGVNCKSYTGTSGTGTSYRGGSGSGGSFAAASVVLVSDFSNAANDTNGNGGNGGIMVTYSWSVLALGGAGVVPGTNQRYAGPSFGIKTNGVGCGGLLNVFCKELINENKIESLGSVAPEITATFDKLKTCYFSGGSSSGGGSVNVFTDKITKQGSVSAAGGRVANQSSLTNVTPEYGGAGGSGSVTVQTVNVNSYSETLFKEIKDEIDNNELIQKTTVSFS